MRKWSSLILAFLAILTIAAPVLACEPPPNTFVNCTDLGGGYRLGFMIYGANNGTYRISSRMGRLVGGAPEDPFNTITISDSNGRVFDWQATMGIDAVIIHAGGTSAVRKLNEARSGDGYYGRTGYGRKPYTIEGISFCYEYELETTASSTGTYTSAGEWQISKTVDVPVQARFAGETAPFQYTVAVSSTSGGEAAGFQVTTEMMVKNSTPITAYLRKIRNYLPAWNLWATVDCGGARFPYALKPGKELRCTATTPVSSLRESESIVRVSSDGLIGVSATTPIAWSGGPSGSGDPIGAVTVTDTNAAFGGPYTVSEPSSWTYPVELTCPTDPSLYTNGVYTMTLDNTATIVEKELSDSQSVALECYAPVLSGAGTSTYDVEYLWDITKTSPITDLKLRQEFTAAIDYDVVVSVVDQVQKNFKSTGQVTVTNPRPDAAMTVTLLDAATQSFPAALKDCANPLSIPAGQSVTCQYEAVSAEAPVEASAIQVLMNNITFGSMDPSSFTGTPGNQTDECVTVYDDAFAEPLGTVCADQASATYEYQVSVGPFEDCSDTDYTNTAYFYTNDTETFDYANWQVLINVLCTANTNCTQPASYWIAFADPDPMLYDTTWNKVGGPGAPFFTTGFTWLGILNDTSTGEYYQLAREYAVGQLNVLHGSSATPQVLSALDHAAVLLTDYAATRDSITDKAVITDFNSTRLLIRNYNNGLTGPGVCPDCTID